MAHSLFVIQRKYCLPYCVFLSLRHFLSIVPQILLITCSLSNNRQIHIDLSRLLIVCYQIIEFNHFILIPKNVIKLNNRSPKNLKVAWKNSNPYKPRTFTKETIALVCHIAIASNILQYLPSCSQRAFLYPSVSDWLSLETYSLPFCTHAINQHSRSTAINCQPHSIYSNLMIHSYQCQPAQVYLKLSIFNINTTNP